MSDQVLSCSGLARTFSEGALHVEVLRGVALDVQAGETIAIVGASGSGKSTLLHLLGGLDVPTEGEVWVKGERLDALSDEQRGYIRNQHLGFVYQFHHLLPEFTLIENVAMPLWVRGMEREGAAEQARTILGSINLQHRTEHRPAELSGGERQRGAIARALVTRPSCILADEPTGNLDSSTAGVVFEQMMRLNQEINTSLVMVTHDENLAGRMDRVLRLRDGLLN